MISVSTLGLTVYASILAINDSDNLKYNKIHLISSNEPIDKVEERLINNLKEDDLEPIAIIKNK